ncbi:hypothetical protein Asppvi_006271 [Aspergillus pseudoviridinutans]|uniref:Uncharacterized protein n=1 Tax=Aspergillus pseudoviridinutans TaxID=1517512 RepID=A0A9P3BAQ2_9EURO|nr:uncharacterized protein Asppvi_006271 [Aspergillus pseudoviridinutans]GIJ87365.1 hypothetical protein Asppvi_006271 [Aspergillus pseudoviridinutans]
MYPPPLLTVALTLMLSTTSSALQTRDILKPRNWDLRLLGPGCNPNASNIDISVFHRSGLYGTECEGLDTSVYNTTSVKSVSWKSPGVNRYDLCMYSDAGCAAGNADVIRDGWEVCYLFTGWAGFKVVEGGQEC